MPLDAWILLVAAVGLGLSLEVAFYRARLRERSARRNASGSGGAA